MSALRGSSERDDSTAAPVGAHGRRRAYLTTPPAGIALRIRASVEGNSPQDSARILLVDDRPENLRALDEVLRPLGEEIHRASSADDAVRLCQSYEFAVILLDVQMPTIGGFEAARLIKQEATTAATPIIFLSAADADSDRISAAYAAGAVDFLTKPYHPDLLRAKVQVFTDLYRARERQKREQAALVAEQVARASAERGRMRLEHLLESLGDAFIAIDSRNLISYVNARGEAFLGAPRHALLGEDLCTAIERVDPGVLTDALRLAIRSNTTTCTEVDFPTRGQTYEASAYPSPDGRSIFLRDITERLAATQALEHKGRILALAEQVAGLGSWEWIPDGDFAWSDQMYRIFGFDLPGPKPTPESVLERVHEGDRDSLIAAFRKAADDGKPFVLQHRLAGMHGHGERVLQVAGTVERDADGAVARVIGTTQDVTEHRRSEEALRAAEERLQQAQKMEVIGQFAGSIAHDFNNVLTIIGTSTQFLSDALPADGPEREDLKEMMKAVSRGSALVQRLMSFGRIQDVAPQPLDLNLVIKELEPLLDRLVGSRIPIKVEYGAGVPPVLIDPVQLEQIVLNLVANARDAMPNGGTTVIRTAVRSVVDDDPTGVDPGRYVVLSVSDTGFGMDLETQRRIFEPFFTTKDIGEGTGLGLATVRGIVDQAGARLVVESRPGDGSTFRIFFPPA